LTEPAQPHPSVPRDRGSRLEPPDNNPELAALNSRLDYERATLLIKLEALRPGSAMLTSFAN
jgi:hypothetical protein